MKESTNPRECSGNVAFGKTWGVKPRVVNWLYTAIIRPILCFGCHVLYQYGQIEVGAHTENGYDGNHRSDDIHTNQIA